MSLVGTSIYSTAVLFIARDTVSPGRRSSTYSTVLQTSSASHTCAANQGVLINLYIPYSCSIGMLAAGLRLPPSAAAHQSRSKQRISTRGQPAAAARALPLKARAAPAAYSNTSMTSGVAAAELDALVQDAIVWASQHGLVSCASVIA
jgi:hypothetical protein